MKMTLQEKADILNIQYILEYLIECYNKTDCESEKYKIKSILIEFIIDTKVSLKQTISYMELDKDKFEPFLNLLKDVKEVKRKNMMSDTDDNANYDNQSQFAMFMPQNVCFIRRIR